jgi:hypothetical protein
VAPSRVPTMRQEEASWRVSLRGLTIIGGTSEENKSRSNGSDALPHSAACSSGGSLLPQEGSDVGLVLTVCIVLRGSSLLQEGVGSTQRRR